MSRCGQHRAAFRALASDSEHLIATSDPAELDTLTDTHHTPSTATPFTPRRAQPDQPDTGWVDLDAA